MATTASGVTIPGSSPTTTAATPIQDHWNNLGKSLNGRIVVPVASVTARAALVSALTAEGYTPSTATPIIVWRADAAAGYRLEISIDGTAWSVVGSTYITGSKVTTPGAPFTTWAGFVTANVTGDGVTRFRITASFAVMLGTVANDTFDVTLKETVSGTVIKTARRTMLNAAGGVVCDGLTIVAIDVPAAGARTYSLDAARQNGTGTATMYANTAAPLEITVEQI